jgi:hypothetical protein
MLVRNKLAALRKNNPAKSKRAALQNFNRFAQTQIRRNCVAGSSNKYGYGIARFGSKEVTMSAVAEFLSTTAIRADPRGSELPTCPVCADSMVAAEASAYVSDSIVSYLWTCDTCGYGFVTKHQLKRLTRN